MPARFDRLTALPFASSLAAVMLCCQANAQEAPKSSDTLKEVTVKGAQDRPDTYRATTTRSTKTLQDPHEVPQAITTVTRTVMDEQQTGSLREALRNVSGLTFNAAEGGRSGDNMMLRGFYTFGDIYLDGIRDTAQYNRETFNTEQVDVLRGAAAMLFGRGQAGGVINQVTKRPFSIDQGSVTVGVGSQGYLQTQGDFNKRLGENAAIRINAMSRTEGSNRVNPSIGDDAQVNRDGLALALVLGQGTKHEFNLQHSTTRTKDRPDYGLSFNTATRRINENFSPNTWWGSAATFDDSDTNLTTLGHVWRIASDTELRTQYRRADYERAYWGKTPNLTAAPNASVSNGGNQTRHSSYTTDTIQSDLTTAFKTGSIRHEVLAGVEFLQEDSYRRALLNVGTAAVPVYTPSAENTGVTANTFKGKSYAFYAQDSIEFLPKFRALLGLRQDRLEATYPSVGTSPLRFSETSTRTGISYHPSTDTHYYLSASDSFSPTADLYQLSGNAYPAERSKVYELGAKWMLLEGDLSLRAAMYRADKDWERNTDLESSAAILTRKRRTNGVELEAAGRLSEKWEIFSGLALMDARIKEVAENRNATTGVVTYADAKLVGQRARNTPAYTLNLWTTYDIGGGFKLGGGAEAKGKRLAYQPQTANAAVLFNANGQFTPNTAPAYVRWDAMMQYETKQWTLRANIQNLLDKVYYDALYDNGGFGVPGTRRKFLVSATYKF
jgi:catecholate siderophore receptor